MRKDVTENSCFRRAMGSQTIIGIKHHHNTICTGFMRSQKPNRYGGVCINSMPNTIDLDRKNKIYKKNFTYLKMTSVRERISKLELSSSNSMGQVLVDRTSNLTVLGRVSQILG